MMSSPFNSLDHIPAFHAVMTRGSLSAAARVLRLAHPTVRRHIEALEEELNTQLFTRAANGLTPTEMAHTLLPMAQSVLEQAAALARAASGRGGDLAGILRLTCSRIVAAHVLPAALLPLRSAAPDLAFEIAATDQAENLAQRAADIAIRFTAPTQQALVAQRLPDVEVGFFAHKDLPAPQTLQDLGSVPFISDDRDDLLLPGLQAAGLPAPRNVVLRCDDPLAQLAYLTAGMGVGVCQTKLAARLDLRRVLPDIRYPMPTWLVVHEDQARIARIRYVFDHLKTALPPLM